MNNHILSKSDIIFFEMIYKKLLNKLPEITDEVERYILNQIHLFHSGSITIKDIKIKDKNLNIIKSEDELEGTLLFRIVSGSILRQLFESFIRVIYLCSTEDINERNNRFERIVSGLCYEYNKYLKDENHQSYGNSMLDDLPTFQKNISCQKLSIPEILRITNMEHLYPIYRIACFYSHGIIDDISWEHIWQKKAENMPSIDVFKMIFLIAKSYTDIIKQIWGERFPELFSE